MALLFPPKCGYQFTVLKDGKQFYSSLLLLMLVLPGVVRRVNNTDSNTLVSVGLGLRLQLNDRLTARVDWGIPLVDISQEGESTLQENGIYFSIVSSPF
jgi:hemolysin activation/secretion protein